MASPPPPTRASIKIVKSMPYLGGTQVWSNRYFFGGITSMTLTQFNNLYAAIEAAEKLIMSSWVGWSQAVQYDAGSDVPVRSASLSGSGSLAHSGERLCPGDCAMMTRFSTTQRSTKNHPIYLYKWFHGVYYDDASQPDTLWSSQKSALGTFAGDCVSGFNDGSTAQPISGPYGAVAQGHEESQWIKHRDFPR